MNTQTSDYSDNSTLSSTKSKERSGESVLVKKYKETKEYFKKTFPSENEIYSLYSPISNINSLQKIHSSSSSKEDSSSGKIDQKIREEVNKNNNPIVSFSYNVCGEKGGERMEYVANVVSICLHLDYKKDFISRVRRFSMIMFQVALVSILFVMFIYATYSYYPYYHIEKDFIVNATTGRNFTISNEVLDWKNIPTWMCLTVGLVMTAIVILFNMVFPKYEVIWGVLTILVIMGIIDFILIDKNIPVMLFGVHVLSTAILWFASFTFSNMKVKLFFFIAYVLNMIGLMIFDLVMKDEVIAKVTESLITEDNYNTAILINYFLSFSPTFLLIFFFSVKMLTEVKFLQKITTAQRNILKKYEGIEEKDIESILADKKSEKNFNIATLNINKSLYEIDASELKMIEKLGEGGSSSIVFLCRWKGKEVAYKIFKLYDFLGKEMFKEFEKEVSILASIAHPNVLRFFGACLSPPRVGIVMEYCFNRDLRKFLIAYKKLNNHDFMISEKIRVFKEIISAMEYLHSIHIIHRDIKSENILLTRSLESRIMDFGVSRIVNNSLSYKTKRVGTSFYMAPEVVLGHDYSNACDIYSFGIMMYCVITENWHPFEGVFEKKHIKNIEFRIANDSKARPKFLESEWKKCRWLMDIIKVCWDSDASIRPSFKRLFEMFEKKNSGLKNAPLPNTRKDDKAFEKILKEVNEEKELTGNCNIFTKLEEKFGKGELLKLSNFYLKEHTDKGIKPNQKKKSNIGSTDSFEEIELMEKPEKAI